MVWNSKHTHKFRRCRKAEQQINDSNNITHRIKQMPMRLCWYKYGRERKALMVEFQLINVERIMEIENLGKHDSGNCFR